MWETMPEREIFKAERVVIKDSVEEGARHIIQLDTQPRVSTAREFTTPPTGKEVYLTSKVHTQVSFHRNYRLM